MFEHYIQNYEYNIFIVQSVPMMLYYIQFRDIVMECTNEVCGMRRVGGEEKKGD